MEGGGDTLSRSLPDLFNANFLNQRVPVVVTLQRGVRMGGVVKDGCVRCVPSLNCVKRVLALTLPPPQSQVGVPRARRTCQQQQQW